MKMDIGIGWLFLLLAITGLLGAGEPSALYLTWVGDPSSTMAIQWHTGKEEESRIFYQKEGEEKWQQMEGRVKPIRRTAVFVHVVELTELEEDSDYAFKMGEEGEIYRFRTLPRDLKREVRFVVGGDAYSYLNVLKKMNREIAKSDPDFVILGGDIAYAHGRASLFRGGQAEIKRWQTFFREWKKMVTTEGRLIPLLVVIGNHDVKGPRLDPKEAEVMFYELFAFPEEGIPYRTLDIGSYLNVFLLDTGHTYSIGGQQSLWLEQALKERENTPFKMAVYHVSAYPSVYPYSGKASAKIRKSWSPLFERYGVQVAFEHHNHAYKRTFPIKGEKIDPDGVIYLGDGAWGVAPRKPLSPQKAWYLAKSKAVNCFWLATLREGECALESRDLKGRTIERFAIKRLSERLASSP